jgi:hypothetical protein
MKTLLSPTSFVFTRVRSWLLMATVISILNPQVSTLSAATLLPFQGRVTDSNGVAVADGARVVQFKIYDAPVGGRAVWNGEVQKLTINAGLVSTILGTKAALSRVDFNLDLYLEITIDANGDNQITLADPPLLPRQSILPAIFSHESADSRLLDGHDWSALFGTNNPADGTLLDSKIRDAGITTAKIAADAVTAAKIANAGITTAKIADNAVTSAKIANGAVMPVKLSTTGASAGQFLGYNGSQVVWTPVHATSADQAANADTLDGFDWGTIFTFANPAAGTLHVEDVVIRQNLNIGNGNYRHLTMGGGNSSGYLYGSYPTFGDGIHLGYNYFAGEPGQGGVVHPDGATSRVTVGYGFVSICVGGIGQPPTIERFRATTTGMQVFGTFNYSSDRNAKRDFSPVNPAEILEKVARLPISEWSYKEDPTTRHIGPVSQDFYSIFNIGTDEKSIAPIDEGGIALAAIQALNEKVEQKEKAIQDLQDRLEKLEQRLNRELPSEQ